jgi:hypothetical protein
MEALSPLLFWDTLVMVVEVGEEVIAGRVGEVILCKPRTEVGAA